MAPAERIDALMPESIQAAIPSGVWVIFNQSKHPGVHILCDSGRENYDKNEHKNTASGIKAKSAQLLAEFSEQNTFYAMDAVEVRGLRNFLRGFKQDLAQPRFF